jgi:hypothetical protein
MSCFLGQIPVKQEFILYDKTQGGSRIGSFRQDLTLHILSNYGGFTSPKSHSENPSIYARI